jgi:hypothetical protein
MSRSISERLHFLKLGQLHQPSDSKGRKSGLVVSELDSRQMGQTDKKPLKIPSDSKRKCVGSHSSALFSFINKIMPNFIIANN